MKGESALRAAAYVAVHNAVKSGKLTPQPCKQCGFPVADAHHHDYSKPLDVTWLCRLCHVALRSPKGLSRGQSRPHSDEDLVALAEQRLASLSSNGHKPSVAELAQLWGVSNLGARSYILRQGWGDKVAMIVMPPKTSRQSEAQQWIEVYEAKYGIRPTLQQTADHFGVSRERVRQWIAALRSKGAVVSSRRTHPLGRARVSVSLDRKLLKEIKQALPQDVNVETFVESLLNKYGLAYAARFARVSKSKPELAKSEVHA